MKRISTRFISSLVLALAAMLPGMAPASAQGDLLSGQNHYYTVVFRGNGEAIVYAKVVINNISDKPIGDFSFEMPKVSPTEMVVYQMSQRGPCALFDNSLPNRPCLKYSEPDYANQYYYGYPSGGGDYLKISDYGKIGNKYALTLPNPINPGKTSTIVIAYAAQGYSRKTLGAHKFVFETLKVPSRIQQVSVSVDVDSDQILKGKRSSVNYATNDVSLGLSTAATGLSSPAMDKAVSSIGSSSSPIHKQAKNLAAYETLTVKGEYADAWLGLYWGSLAWAILVVAAIFVALFFGAKFLRRRHKRETHSAEAAPSASAWKGSGYLNPAYAVISFLSMGTTIGLAYLVPLVERVMRTIRYDGVFTLVFAIATLLVFLTSVFGPFIFAHAKYGKKSLVSLIVCDLLWLVLFLVVYVILFRSGIASPQYYY